VRGAPGAKNMALRCGKYAFASAENGRAWKLPAEFVS